jgi:ribonuclease HII
MHSIPEEEFLDRGMVFGFDEAGRGPLAGPVSIALVSFSPSTLHKIYSGDLLTGLDDSKKLKPKLREELFLEILSIAEKYRIEFVSPKFIDKFNINQAIFYGIQKALSRLQISHPFLILDGNYKLESNLLDWNHPSYKSIPKADESILSVSAASILAKVARDRYMVKASKVYPEYGFEKNMGYGTKFHRDAIQNQGISRLHRISYLHKIGTR